MADINFILTDAGAAALVNAANTGTDPVIITQCGVSASALVPSAAATSLPDEIKRIGTISGNVTDEDMIHLVVRDESADVYSLKSLALYTDDGTLFAIYGQAATIMEKSAGAMLLLALDLQFADMDAALIQFGDANFLNPPATETMQGVIEIATQAEANAGLDDARAITAKKAKAALLPWLLAQDGAGSGVDADLLDGKDAAAFLELVNFTGAAVLAKLLTADGAGSGMDADLLDGQQGSYYSDIIARLGFTPLDSAEYTANDIRTKLRTVDGSGSGIDADTVDGKQASAFLSAISTAISSGTAGYFVFAPNPSETQKLTLAWGTGSPGANSLSTVTMPITFSTVFTVMDSHTGNADDADNVGAFPNANNSVRLFNGTAGVKTVRYLTIGLT